jgi:predicted nucleic acid-binding protein
MTGWLLDTDVISELNKKQPERRVIDFLIEQPLADLYLSTVTFAEIRYGIQQAHDAERRTALVAFLDRRVRPMFTGRVLQISEDVILRWKIIAKAGQKAGHTFTQPDLFIAAIAAIHELTVVTRNTRDFEKTGVAIYNPWID